MFQNKRNAMIFLVGLLVILAVVFYLFATEAQGAEPSAPSVPADLSTPVLPGGHFTWSEATRGGTRIPSDPELVRNIVRSAQMMEEVRALFGKPITIISWYRPPAVNKAVGGVDRSQHMRALAVDFVVQGYSPREVQARLVSWRGGLGSYPNFTHVDLGPQRSWPKKEKK